MDQKDIAATTKRLLEEYGADAEPLIRRRLQDAMSRRDVQAAGIWRRILRHVLAQRRDRRQAGY